MIALLDMRLHDAQLFRAATAFRTSEIGKMQLRCHGSKCGRQGIPAMAFSIFASIISVGNVLTEAAN